MLTSTPAAIFFKTKKNALPPVDLRESLQNRASRVLEIAVLRGGLHRLHNSVVWRYRWVGGGGKCQHKLVHVVC